MKRDFIIRHIEPGELDSLLTLYSHLHRKDAPLPEKPELDAIWAEIVSNPILHYIAGEWENEIVSSCTIAIIPNLTRGARPYGLIENVVTRADLRKRGFGTAILRYALQVAWGMNCYKVMLLTGSEEESTLQFYEGAGFKRGIKLGFVAYPPGKDQA
nr:GNAT family N-acetyltransferase [Candidatus Njordarchaeum guaymaensis]